MKRELNVLSGGKSNLLNDDVLDDEDSFEEIINAHFPFIEKQCFKAVHLKAGEIASEVEAINFENEALELSNHILDTLQKDNFRVLKEFKGQSRLTTYLTAIISRQAVDMIRKKRGRSREKERAKLLGEAGLILYQQVIKNGCPIHSVFEQLKSTGLFHGSLAQLEAMAAKIKGKNPHTPPSNSASGNGSTVKNGTVSGDNEIIIPDTHSDPQVLLMENQRQAEIHQAVQTVLAQLSGTERLLLKMRFPIDDEKKPLPVGAISTALGISEKAVYKRVARLIEKCKDKLARAGVHVHDLL